MTSSDSWCKNGPGLLVPVQDSSCHTLSICHALPTNPRKKPPRVQTHSFHYPVPSSHPSWGLPHFNTFWLGEENRGNRADQTEAGEKKGTESIAKRKTEGHRQTESSRDRSTEKQRPMRAPSLRETEADGARGPARGMAEQGHREPDTVLCCVWKGVPSLRKQPWCYQRGTSSLCLSGGS